LFATQVQPSHSRRPEIEDHHLEDRVSYVHKPKAKTDFGDVLVPDDKDQQNPHRRVTTADSNHLQAGEHEPHHVAGYNAMHVDTKYETTFKKAMQQTAPMDAIFPMRKDSDNMIGKQTHNEESVAYKVACQMDAKIKTHLKEKTYVTDRRGTTDGNEMLADSTYQQGMYETYQEEEEDKAYPKNAAVSSTTTNDDPQNNNAQCRLMCGNFIPREFFINQALPEVLINQTGVVISSIDSTSAIIRMDVKDKTTRGIEFLHILNGVPRQTGTVDIARRPAVPNATSKKGKPNVQGTLCQDDVPGAVANQNFNTNTSSDLDGRTETADKTEMIAVYKIYNGVPSQTGSEDIARRPAVPNAASVKGEPNVKDVPDAQDSIDVPGTTANYNFNTKSPEDGQTNRMADKSETKKIAMPAIREGGRGHN
jgi:hypothetical protein